MKEFEKKRTISEQMPCLVKSLNLSKREVKAEMKHVENLMKIQCNTRWSDVDNEVYIMPAKWLDYWKEHVNYSNSCCSSVNSEINASPNPISYKEIMMQSEEYYHSPNSLDQFKWILKEKAKEEKDYYIVSKELWEFLHKKYGGDEAIRYRIYYHMNSSKKLDIKFSKVILNLHFRQKLLSLLKAKLYVKFLV